MAEGVVSFGVEKLWDLLSRESERLQGTDEQIDELSRELESLRSLLKDAYAKKHDSERVKNFLEDVKDIVYDAEDIIESFLLKELEGEEKGIKKQARKCQKLACFLVDRRGFASDIESITKRISKVIGGMQSLGIQQIIDGGRSLSMQDRQRQQREIRQTFPNSDENDLVGVEQSVEELVDHLVGNDNVQVVSISGMGGIGKTTLARKVFHHDIVRRCFDGFAWVCVSQEFTRKHVWQRILQELQQLDGDNITKMDECTLQDKLFKLLQTGRYLLVFDDLWKEEDWDQIKTVFPEKRGWKMKVVLTSRNEGVGLHADPTCFTFRTKILTPEDSWKLCEKIVFPKRDETEFRVDEELEAMGKKMVTYCGGLPLAIKVLGGLLAKKNTFLEWKRVYDNIGNQIVGKPRLNDNNSLNSVYRVLSLSYEDLPMHLKHCFLYLAHFPEDHGISVEELFYYWAAEGITNDGPTIQDSGEEYLEELVRRNLVVSETTFSRSRVKSCQMHDMMREVCLSKAKEENFLQVINVRTSTSTINAHASSRSRRLAVHNGNALHMLRHKNNKKVRSLLAFGVTEDYGRHYARGGFQSIPLLRVLDLSLAVFKGNKLPSSIGELIHLRFLSLRGAEVSHLPSSMRKLKLLLYLNLDVSGTSVHVPNVLKDMVELRYLYLPDLMHDKAKLELGNLVNLEFLKNFSTKQSSVTDLLCMTKLRDLYVSFINGCTSEALSSCLHELKYLEMLSLVVSGDHKADVLMDFIHLKELVLESMPRMPEHHRFPPGLTSICLQYCNMEEDPMPILEKLFHLEVVMIALAFKGRKMVCSKGGFPQLRDLHIHGQEELEEWIVEKGSMPCLRMLSIAYCGKLKKFPDGLKDITSLKELVMAGMKREWKEKLVPGGVDYYKVQHIHKVQFIDCDDQGRS